MRRRTLLGAPAGACMTIAALAIRTADYLARAL